MGWKRLLVSLLALTAAAALFSVGVAGASDSGGAKKGRAGGALVQKRANVTRAHMRAHGDGTCPFHDGGANAPPV